MHEFDKCIITNKNGAKISEGIVSEYNSADMRINTTESHNLRVYDEVLIYVYNQLKGECKYEGTVSQATGSRITLFNVSLVRSVQKRDNTRVSKQLKYMVTHSFRGDRAIKLEKPIEITVLNISAQGLYLNSTHDFAIGSRFPLVLQETIKPIKVTVEILRKEKYTRSFNYGCQFADISQKDMDEIFRFVLKEQIDQRRRNLLFHP
ncbi:MAG TPA: PilZ domain-containing protein [Clostridia bacterium]|nr:PilZ domain-containing protein [Clostridia bacterium]